MRARGCIIAPLLQASLAAVLLLQDKDALLSHTQSCYAWQLCVTPFTRPTILGLKGGGPVLLLHLLLLCCNHNCCDQSASSSAKLWNLCTGTSCLLLALFV